SPTMPYHRRRVRSDPVNHRPAAHLNQQACLASARIPSTSAPEDSIGAGDGTEKRSRFAHHCTSHSILRSSVEPAATVARLPEAFPRARLENPSTNHRTDYGLDSPESGLQAPRYITLF